MAKRGNKCLEGIQTFCNILLLIMSLGYVALGLDLILKIGAGFIPITFIIIGAIEILLAFFVFCNPTSKGALTLYLWVLSFLVGFQAALTAIALIFTDQIQSWFNSQLEQDQQQYDELKENIDIALYIAIGASAIQVVCLLVTLWYRATLKRVLTSKEKKLLKESGYANDDYDEKNEKKRLEKFKAKVSKKYREKLDAEREDDDDSIEVN